MTATTVGVARLEILELDLGHLEAAAQVHVAAFPKSALAKLGVEAVRRYYEWLLVGPHQTTALGAFRDQKLLGFLFGGTFNGAMTGFLHLNRGYLAARVASRPWLVATPLFRRRIASALGLLARRQPRRIAPPTPAQGPPAFAVLAIAVAPHAQGSGAGKRLIASAEDVARRDGFTVMELTVADWNQQAIHFYEGGGWRKVLIGVEWTNGLMRKRLG